MLHVLKRMKHVICIFLSVASRTDFVVTIAMVHDSFYEPMVRASIICPDTCIGSLTDLCNMRRGEMEDLTSFSKYDPADVMYHLCRRT
jgi:translation elongation factor EF-4